MSEAEVKAIAENAAEEALRKFLLVLGVDVSTGPATIELQRDFHHLRQSRLTARTLWDKVLSAAAGSLGTAIVGGLVLYFSTRGH